MLIRQNPPTKCKLQKNFLSREKQSLCGTHGQTAWLNRWRAWILLPAINTCWPNAPLVVLHSGVMQKRLRETKPLLCSAYCKRCNNNRTPERLGHWSVLRPSCRARIQQQIKSCSVTSVGGRQLSRARFCHWSIQKVLNNLTHKLFNRRDCVYVSHAQQIRISKPKDGNFLSYHQK